MFFPHYVKVKRTDKVLDVGSGAYPYRRANVLCDKYNIGDEHDCLLHCGKPVLVNKKPFYRIVDNLLPFGDKEFDVSTCACVLEHVPLEDLHTLVAEIERVSKSVYIEVPKPFYDCVYNIDPHLNLCDILEDGTIIFIDKKNTHLKRLSGFNEWAWQLRKEGVFSLDEHPKVTAVGRMYYGEIPIRIIRSEREFFHLVHRNKYFCKPATIVDKAVNVLRGFTYKRHKEPRQMHAWHE